MGILYGELYGILNELIRKLTVFTVNLTFIGPCIVIYSYSTTNMMHLFLKLFILVKHSTCFGRSFRTSSGAQNCTYGNRHMSNGCCYSPTRCNNCVFYSQWLYMFRVTISPIIRSTMLYVATGKLAHLGCY